MSILARSNQKMAPYLATFDAIDRKISILPAMPVVSGAGGAATLGVSGRRVNYRRPKTGQNVLKMVSASLLWLDHG